MSEQKEKRVLTHKKLKIKHRKTQPYRPLWSTEAPLPNPQKLFQQNMYVYIKKKNQRFSI